MKFGRFKNRIKPEGNKENNGLSDKEVTTENIKSVLSDSDDVSYQVHYINGRRDLPVSVIFVDGLVETKIVNDDILKPLVQEKF